MLRFEEGARGLLWASQVATGNQNNLRLRVYGEKGGLEWRQEEPNCLWFSVLGKPPGLIYRAGPAAGPVAAHASRVPAGHPSGAGAALSPAAVRWRREPGPFRPAVEPS